jgi:lysine 2,3-aminomutase
MYHGRAPRPDEAHPAQTPERGPLVGAREGLERFAPLDEAIWRAADARFPVRVTRSWADRIDSAADPGAQTALRLQALPAIEELVADPREVPDPVGEAHSSPVPWVVRKHADRALLLVTRRCHLHCRYCFRRDQWSAEEPSETELDRAIAYLTQAGLEEVILSGGDPLTLRNARLDAILGRLRPSVPLVRIHTRAPITAPDRVTPDLVALLRKHRPLWVVVHANHPSELDGSVGAALERLLDAGIPVHNQSVLLRGVNDDPDVLVALCRRLVALGVAPYYLHHPDPVPGAAHFQVGLDDGLRIYAELERRVSGLALPRYVIDPPDGSGKVAVRDYVRKLGPPEG